MEEVEQICSRIMIMDGGRVLAQGANDQLKRLVSVGEKIVVELVGASPSRGRAAANTVGELAHVLSCEFVDGELHVACEASEHNLTDVLGALRAARVRVGACIPTRPRSTTCSWKSPAASCATRGRLWARFSFTLCGCLCGSATS